MDTSQSSEHHQKGTGGAPGHVPRDEQKRYGGDVADYKSDFRYSPIPGKPYGEHKPGDAPDDDDLIKRVRRRLATSATLRSPPSNLDLSYNDGVLTIAGTVESSDDKRFIEGCVTAEGWTGPFHNDVTIDASVKEVDADWPPQRVRQPDPQLATSEHLRE